MVFCKTSLATNHPPTLEAIDGGGGSPSTLSFWSFMGPWLMQWGLTCMETQEVDKTVAPCVCKVGRQSCDIEAGTRGASPRQLGIIRCLSHPL